MQKRAAVPIYNNSDVMTLRCIEFGKQQMDKLYLERISRHNKTSRYTCVCSLILGNALMLK